jgi:hypothetical protein
MADQLSLRLVHDPRSRQGHGSRACYTRGCREPICRAANAAYQRDYRDGMRGTHANRKGGYVLNITAPGR